MLNGVHSVYFVKQLDFMLLGMDHFVNTFNFIRCSRDLTKLGSFTIILLICDQGLQGPQSSGDSFAEFGSIARIPCYTLTNSHDADYILRTQLTAPGFRMIGMSMKLFKTEFMQIPALHTADDASVIQYADGADATIVTFNFGFQDGVAVQKKFAESGKSAALFHANYVPFPSWDRIRESVARTGKLIVIDDSKSVHLPCYQMIDALHEAGVPFRRLLLTRGPVIDFGICDDKFPVDAAAVVAQMK
jgi:pyruvate/2-oxoglutarate/acetoin dehydrogenase E1 component